MSDEKFLKAELDKITDDVFAYGLPGKKDGKQIRKKKTVSTKKVSVKS